MRFLVGIFIACLWASSAFAQAGVVVNYRNSGNQPTEVSPSNPLPTVDAMNGAVTAVSSVTRASNTTTYTANTGWCGTTSTCSTVFSFANVCRANGGNIIVPNIDIYSSANPSTKLSGVLWLFNVTPGTVVNDNATFNIAGADFANLVGGSENGIPFTLASAQASGASNSGTSLTGINAQIQCATGSTTLYGMVQVVNAYVPTSAEVLNVTLHTVGAN